MAVSTMFARSADMSDNYDELYRESQERGAVPCEHCGSISIERVAGGDVGEWHYYCRECGRQVRGW